MKLINPANGTITGELIFDTDESMRNKFEKAKIAFELNKKTKPNRKN